jgi:hypothetical protein
LSNDPSVTDEALVAVLRGFGLSTLGANAMDQTHRTAAIIEASSNAVISNSDTEPNNFASLRLKATY